MKRKSCFLGVPLFEERGTALSLFCLYLCTFKRVENFIKFIMFLGWWRVLRHEAVFKNVVSRRKKQNKKYNLSINRPTTKSEVNARRRTLHHSDLNYYNSKHIYRLNPWQEQQLYEKNSPPLFEERYIIETTVFYHL